MKKFIIPLLPTLALPTAFNRGILVSAHFNYKLIPKRYQTKKIYLYQIAISLNWHFGIRVISR